MSIWNQTGVVVTAAGKGTRAGGPQAKQWQQLAGQPVLLRAVRKFARATRIVVVVPEADLAHAAAVFGGNVTLVAGGASRSASVRAGLEALAGLDAPRFVLIHDGARPLVSAHVIEGVLAALAAGAQAAAPGLAVTDALWRVDGSRITAEAPRDGLMRAQTPQGFALDAILRLHRAGAEAADDIALARAGGLDPVATLGDEDNIKITWPGDLARAETILERARMDVRLGNGFDVHALGPGDHVMLCGVRVAHDHGLVGHSDADVGMHALTDAIYGALAEGDIGRHFPPPDPQWKGADSAHFLAHATERMRTRGFRLGNADVTLICEQPKIGPHSTNMIARLAQIMGVEADRVSVKATTSERLGFTGRGEGIAALATASLIATNNSGDPDGPA